MTESWLAYYCLWGKVFNVVKHDLEKHRKTTISASGLTLVEVIVGMLVAALCLGTALQAYVAAVSIKVRTRQLNTAIAKIDADAETIRQLAQSSDPSHPCTGNYAQVLMTKVVALDAESAPIGGAELASPSPSPSDSPPEASPEPGSSPSPYSLLLSDLPPNYQLERKMAIDPNIPKVLKVSYTLNRLPPPPDPDAPPLVPPPQPTLLAQLSLAVMPRDVLLCP